MSQSGKVTLTSGNEFLVDDVVAVEAAMLDGETHAVKVQRGGREITINTDVIAFAEPE